MMHKIHKIYKTGVKLKLAESIQPEVIRLALPLNLTKLQTLLPYKLFKPFKPFNIFILLLLPLSKFVFVLWIITICLSTL